MHGCDGQTMNMTDRQAEFLAGQGKKSARCQKTYGAVRPITDPYSVVEELEVMIFGSSLIFLDLVVKTNEIDYSKKNFGWIYNFKPFD